VGFALFFVHFSSESSKKQRFFTGLFWFAAVQCIQLSWMTSIEFQGYYILFVYASLCLLLGAQFGLLCVYLTRLNPLALAALWTLLEWARLHVACGFSWNPIGLSLAFHPIPMQGACLFGVLGLSFWVMLVNLFALKALRERKLSVCGFWITLAALPYLFGWVHLQSHTGRIIGDSLHVALVQTGLLPSEKIPLPKHQAAHIDPQTQWENITSHLQQQGSPSWDLILLPEAVVPLQADIPQYHLEQIENNLPKEHFSFVFPFVAKRTGRLLATNLFWAKAIANTYQADVVLGLDHYDMSEKTFFNSAFLVTPSAESVERYDKRILLPLAEYLPFRWLHRWTKSYGIYDFFSHGKNLRPLQGKHSLSVSICYEETFSQAIRTAARAGGDLLVNLTNDNYYPYSLLPEQHFSHARLRAVENGRPLLRCCNTGVTAVIDSLGRIVSRFGTKGDEFKQGVLDAHFIPYKYNTLYTLWGDVALISLCFSILLYPLLSSFLRKAYLPRKGNSLG
jgi:apolipoprotein N-acyltransferase